MTRVLLCFFALAAALCGCIESAPVPDEEKSSAPGFGSSARRPEGTPLSFPAGVTVADNPHWDESCVSESNNQVYGVGGVRFCMQFSNSSNTPVLVTIPAGTVFVSESTASPNGLIVKEIQIWIAAKRTVIAQLMTCSINQDRKAPAAAFDAQPVLTNHYNMPELLSLLETKQINAEDYNGTAPPQAVSATVQAAVHQLAHTGQLSVNSREKLSQLPEK